MNPDTRRRVAAATAALAAYAACATPTPAEPQHTAHGDVPKMDYARPASQDTPESFAAPARFVRSRASRSRSARAPQVRGSGGCTLDVIRQRESGGRYDAVSPSGRYRGAYQFDRQTWQSVGGSGDPAAASPEEQDARAAELMRQRGTQPWSVCR